MIWRGVGWSLRWLGLTLVGLVLLTALLWWWGMDPRAPGARVAALNAALAPWRTLLQVLRLVLWCLLGYYWVTLGRRLGWPPARQAVWVGLRTRVIGGLLVLEGLILASRFMVSDGGV